MTVRGEECMADKHNATASGQSSATCNGHTDQRTGQQSAGDVRHTGTGAGPIREGVYDTDGRRCQGTRDSCLSRATEVDDELPLGSEANNLRQAQEDGVAAQPPVDRRLWSLRQRAGGGTGLLLGGGGGGGGGQLLHSGWTSFNSDVSNLTSGSNHSASSVEWLLQERQVDPERILLNLGFGGNTERAAPTTMYTRIPDRFLHAQTADLPAEEDVLAAAEGAPLTEAAPARNPSRGQYLKSLFGKACLSHDYCRYILSKVPDYYFSVHHSQAVNVSPHHVSLNSQDSDPHPVKDQPESHTHTAAEGEHDSLRSSSQASFAEECANLRPQDEDRDILLNDAAAKSWNSFNRAAKSSSSLEEVGAEPVDFCSEDTPDGSSKNMPSAEGGAEFSKPDSDNSAVSLNPAPGQVSSENPLDSFLQKTANSFHRTSDEEDKASAIPSPSSSVDGTSAHSKFDTVCADANADSHPAETDVTLQINDDDVMSSSVQTVDDDNISSSSEEFTIGDDVDFSNDVTQYSNTSLTS